MKLDYTYCSGIRCAIKEFCFRYTEGCKVPKDGSGYWWMEDCGEDREAYVSK